MAPMGKPITVPRSQGLQDRDQSRAVIQTDPLTAITASSAPPRRPAMNSASPTANRATASVVTSTPSRSCGTPKDSRAWPVNWSIPTSASDSPTKSEISPLRALSPKADETVTKASTISAK